MCHFGPVWHHLCHLLLPQVPKLNISLICCQVGLRSGLTGSITMLLIWSHLTKTSRKGHICTSESEDIEDSNSHDPTLLD